MRTVRGLRSNAPIGRSRSELKVYGMRDATAAQLAYAAIAAMQGVHQINVDIAHRRMSVSHEPLPGITRTICETLGHLGFRATPKS